MNPIDNKEASMKYFTDQNEIKFFRTPAEFNKYTEQSTLKYAIGANMYMPATQKNVYEKLIHNKFGGLGAITLCMEDAISEQMLPEAQENVLGILRMLHENKPSGANLPLIFIRVRNPLQFSCFAEKLEKDHLAELCGFNFPKFNSLNGNQYFETLKRLSGNSGEILYGMPIIEDENVMFKETRFVELAKIQKILMRYPEHVLNIRVGGTDFSSIYGLRRSADTTIYDIKVVGDCLKDIINFFLRQDCGYVISGPVWEYFSWDGDSKEIRGLERELELDIQNGFMGKTIIHPSQIDTVNRKYIVSYDDYMDAMAILESDGGVFRSFSGRRMNETLPHMNWARKIVAKSEIFGVLENADADVKNS